MLAAVLVACGGDRPGSASSSDSIAAHTNSGSTSGSAGGADSAAAGAKSPAAPKSAERRFEYKSGLVTMKGQGSPAMDALFYFDDYGATLSTQTDIKDSLNGKPLTITNVSILRDNVSVLFDPVKKVGRRSTDPEATMNYFPRFERLTEAQKSALGYRMLGKKTIAGKECTGHSIVRNSITLSVWTWEGIPLRTESTYAPGQSLVLEATSVDLNVVIPPDKFIVPPDIKVSDMPAMGG